MVVVQTLKSEQYSLFLFIFYSSPSSQCQHAKIGQSRLMGHSRPNFSPKLEPIHRNVSNFSPAYLTFATNGRI